MGAHPVTMGDEPDLQEVLDALEDPDCREILRHTDDPRTANELMDACDIPQSTLYRKLDLLESASLVEELVDVHPERGRVSRYVRDVEQVTIDVMGEGEDFAVTIERRADTADERLATMWAQMGEEL